MRRIVGGLAAPLGVPPAAEPPPHPLSAPAAAAILRGSRSGGVLAQACELMRADAEGLEAALEAALQVVVVGARAGRSQGAESELEAEPDE